MFSISNRVFRAVSLYVIGASSIFAQESTAYFIQGRVLISGTGDAAADAEVHVVCNGAHQTVFADARGYFFMLGGEGRSAMPEALWATGPRSADRSARFFAGSCQLTISCPRCYKRVIELERPQSPGVVNLGAVLLDPMGPLAASTVSAAELRIPSQVMGLCKKARQARLRGKLADAERLISTALRKSPDFAAGWFELGRIRQARGDGEQARSAFAHGAALHGSE